MTNKTNLYAIYPASVRYDKRLSDGAYRLYGEVTAAADTNGQCKEDNKYFEALTGKSDRTIYRYFLELEKYGYIKREEIEGERIITLPKEIVEYVAPGKKEKKLVEKDFFEEFIDKWNATVGAKQHKIPAYRELLTARLKTFSQEDLLRAIDHRKALMDNTEWYHKEENKKHITRVELLIRDDKRVEDALNYVIPETPLQKVPDMKKETQRFKFD